MKKQEKLEEIFKVSLTIFANFGFKKATVEDIANELGITKGTLYIYVKDKKDLYEKSVAFALLGWQGRVKEAVEKETEVQKQFIVMCNKALEYLSEDNDLRRILIKDPDIFPIFSKQDPYLEINNNSANLLRTILENGISEKKFRNVDIDSITKIVFSIYKMFIVETYIVEDDESPKRVFDELIKLVTLGLFNTSKDV